MYYDIISIESLEKYKVKIKFSDGKEGVIDLESYIKKGGIFSRLKDIEYFKQMYIDKDLKVLCWPDGLDIAPEILYSKVTNEPLPAWMISKENEKIELNQS